MCFNLDFQNLFMETFCESYGFKSLIENPTCFKNSENPSYIDLILTNSPYIFQNSCAIKTGLSDFHEMIVTAMKSTFQKLKPKIVHCRDYKQFSNNESRKIILLNLSLESIGVSDNDLEKILRYV